MSVDINDYELVDLEEILKPISNKRVLVNYYFLMINNKVLKYVKNGVESFQMNNDVRIIALLKSKWDETEYVTKIKKINLAYI